ncbi:MAG TPA: hypothetical protein VGI70_05050, partial [Polyangiales bacterium]
MSDGARTDRAAIERTPLEVLRGDVNASVCCAPLSSHDATLDIQALRLFDWSDTFMLETTFFRIAVRPSSLRRAAISGLLLLASACSKSAPKPADEAPATAEAKPAAAADKTLKIGFIYV